MSIHIQLLTSELAPLPHVKNIIETIWPQNLREAAYEATAADAYQNPLGQVYAIIFNDTLEDSTHLIGITGFFFDDVPGVAFLRWTGVLPMFQRQGIIRKALKQLVLTIRGANPEIKRLVELVPDDAYGRSKVIPAFESLGFVRDDSLEVPKGEDDEWDCIPYVLNF